MSEETVVMSACKGTAPLSFPKDLADEIMRYLKSQGWRIKDIPTWEISRGDIYEGFTEYYMKLLPNHYLKLHVYGSSGRISHYAEWVREVPGDAKRGYCPIEPWSVAQIFGISHNIYKVERPK